MKKIYRLVLENKEGKATDKLQKIVSKYLCKISEIHVNTDFSKIGLILEYKYDSEMYAIIQSVKISENNYRTELTKLKIKNIDGEYDQFNILNYLIEDLQNMYEVIQKVMELNLFDEIEFEGKSKIQKIRKSNSQKSVKPSVFDDSEDEYIPF